MNLARGQVWHVPLATRPAYLVIVEGDDALQTVPPNVVCLMIDTTVHLSHTVVTVAIDEPIAGTITATDITALTRRRIQSGVHVGTVSIETLDRITRALRTVLDVTL